MRLAVAILALSFPLAAEAETRCGWLSNPTPANYWLQDADGEWTLSIQGIGDRDSGFYDAPWADAPSDWWIETNGSYGYGCACFEGVVDVETRWAIKVTSVTPLPLNRCLQDPALPSR